MNSFLNFSYPEVKCGLTMSPSLLKLVLLILVMSGHRFAGWKVLTDINGWIKTACIPENIKVQGPKY